MNEGGSLLSVFEKKLEECPACRNDHELEFAISNFAFTEGRSKPTVVQFGYDCETHRKRIPLQHPSRTHSSRDRYFRRGSLYSLANIFYTIRVIELKIELQIHKMAFFDEPGGLLVAQVNIFVVIQGFVKETKEIKFRKRIQGAHRKLLSVK